MQKLPKWLKITIRVILLPTAMIIHIIPFLVAYVINLKNWIVYGGEFITYRDGDKTTITDIYQQLKQMHATKDKI